MSIIFEMLQRVAAPREDNAIYDLLVRRFRKRARWFDIAYLITLGSMLTLFSDFFLIGIVAVGIMIIGFVILLEGFALPTKLARGQVLQDIVLCPLSSRDFTHAFGRYGAIGLLYLVPPLVLVIAAGTYHDDTRGIGIVFGLVLCAVAIYPLAFAWIKLANYHRTTGSYVGYFGCILLLLFLGIGPIVLLALLAVSYFHCRKHLAEDLRAYAERKSNQ